jgi:hypothetical protein
MVEFHLTFTSPSDRVFSGIKNFIFLGRINGNRLGNAIWILTLIVYGFDIIVEFYRMIMIARIDSRSPLTGIQVVVSAYIARLIALFLWLLIIRFVLEVGFRLLAVAERE